MSPNEEDNDGLQEVFGAHFTVLLHEVQEGLLVVLPALHDVAGGVRVEQTTKEDPVAEFTRKAVHDRECLKLFK